MTTPNRTRRRIERRRVWIPGLAGGVAGFALSYLASYLHAPWWIGAPAAGTVAGLFVAGVAHALQER